MPDPATAPRVKVCGLTRLRDARAAAAAGAEYLGAVLVPSSPRAVDAASAARIGEARPGSLVVVSADAEPAVLASRARRAEAAVLQLHGDESPADVRRLGEEGSWRVWKAVRVRGAEDVEDALERYGPVADALLLDGWHRDRLGGTGASFPW
ncbi:MAG TPA: phosphoribosylanthranilate isomerase, partial [Longimicrobiales bacterium]|nr:phosphoribosylanthranilate isomerase [Longimicrobiales bacterium]